MDRPGLSHRPWLRKDRREAPNRWRGNQESEMISVFRRRKSFSDSARENAETGIHKTADWICFYCESRSREKTSGSDWPDQIDGEAILPLVEGCSHHRGPRGGGSFSFTALFEDLTAR